jgi:hypothetical protein
MLLSLAVSIRESPAGGAPAGLQELGWTDEPNMRIEYRWASLKLRQCRAHSQIRGGSRLFPERRSRPFSVSSLGGGNPLRVLRRRYAIGSAELDRKSIGWLAPSDGTWSAYAAFMSSGRPAVVPSATRALSSSTVIT